MTEAFIALGANLGDPQAQLRTALQALDTLPHTRLRQASSLYRTAPVGYVDQPDFINAVAIVDTALTADELLAALQGLEQAAGRERSFQDAPRTLDLDLLLYGNTLRHTPALTLPHPRMHQRGFVLFPLLEIAPALDIPGHGPVSTLCAGLDPAGIERL